jgi:hypothetical protein
MRRNASYSNTVSASTARNNDKGRASIVGRDWVKMSRKRVGIGSAISVVGFCAPLNETEPIFGMKKKKDGWTYEEHFLREHGGYGMVQFRCVTVTARRIGDARNERREVNDEVHAGVRARESVQWGKFSLDVSVRQTRRHTYGRPWKIIQRATNS